MEKWFQLTKEEAIRKLQTKENGLTEEEAIKRQETYGQNVLAESKEKSTLRVFLEQFKDLLVIILIIAAIISMMSGNVESTIVIFAVIILNAILGTVQHKKAEKSLKSLKSLSAPNAKLLRNGQKVEIPSAQIVPGDILLLEAGDIVSADGRILENYSLQVNESSLTGESLNIEKEIQVLSGDNIALGDRKNMVFSGSLVAAGRAVVLVTETGMQTEIGKIATLMNNTKEKKTPLQISLDKFSSKLAMIILVICAAVFGLSLYRDMPILDSLMFAVALAVAAIPEALSSIVTIVQAMGTQKMVKENAIIKELKAVESLGCVSVICSDKTGTLTQNKMTVQKIYVNHKEQLPKEADQKDIVVKYLIDAAILTNDSSITEGKQIGDPTETALIEMARKIGLDENLYRKEFPRTGELPFDSDRKLMSTRHKIDGEDIIFTKGAIDTLLERTKGILTAGGVKEMTQEDRKKIMEQNDAFSQEGLRVLTFAYKLACANHNLCMECEQDYIFIGLIAMMDPPREESKEAVKDAKNAGIMPVMITGDHKVTATAIAKQIGIFEDGNMALTGMELDAMPEEELREKLAKIAVYARVSPEHKIRIVNAWQEKGNIVAMTGDGVNDAPALKKADIGVAMGITGTEVSKDAAAMILTDDNFATIIKAVANGRNVYRNIKNAIRFLLSGNMAGILSVLYASLFALPMPFAPVHLLFINLLTDSLPAIAIGMEPADKGLLKQPPRDPKEGILTKDFLMNIFIQGGLIAIATMAAFHMGLNTGNAAIASTMAFATLTLARLFHGFNCRSPYSIFKVGFKSNPYSLLAFGAGIVLLTAVLWIPGLQRLFSAADISGMQLATVAVLAAAPTILIQIVRLFTGKRV